MWPSQTKTRACEESRNCCRGGNHPRLSLLPYTHPISLRWGRLPEASLRRGAVRVLRAGHAAGVPQRVCRLPVATSGPERLRPRGARDAGIWPPHPAQSSGHVGDMPSAWAGRHGALNQIRKTEVPSCRRHAVLAKPSSAWTAWGEGMVVAPDSAGMRSMLRCGSVWNHAGRV